MKKLILISLLFSSTVSAKENIFTQGNTEYANENYSAAISLYDSIISSGLESSELYYNLGNCHYKIQNWANAIWHYEKSIKLNPNNKDARHNLEFTQLRIIDQIETLPQLFYKRWYNNLVRILPAKTWQILTIICIWIILIIYLLKRFANYKQKYSLYSIYAICLILLLTTYSSYKENHQKIQAIIFSSTVVVNSAPTESSVNLFSLHAGTKIELIDHIENWIKIKISDGRDGWMKKSDCKTLN